MHYFKSFRNRHATYRLPVAKSISTCGPARRTANVDFGDKQRRGSYTAVHMGVVLQIVFWLLAKANQAAFGVAVSKARVNAFEVDRLLNMRER